MGETFSAEVKLLLEPGTVGPYSINVTGMEGVRLCSLAVTWNATNKYSCGVENVVDGDTTLMEWIAVQSTYETGQEVIRDANTNSISFLLNGVVLPKWRRGSVDLVVNHGTDVLSSEKVPVPVIPRVPLNGSMRFQSHYSMCIPEEWMGNSTCPKILVKFNVSEAAFYPNLTVFLEDCNNILSRYSLEECYDGILVDPNAPCSDNDEVTKLDDVSWAQK
ncbi:unnamed protein product [Darwinula stevensoni]|uniref:Uncharacterized protein n=1 Tax=Darwinula stevensoni TaxID=69355 RepID=A0A7R8XDQ7_9CRUS|nr:unnamed protein product [Darwinula stevensoni]CAG0894569.1 unnamed protein product [Darwinula stevensoni]